MKTARILGNILRNLAAMSAAGHLPSRRAVAAVFKLGGRRLERRWPFLPKAEGKDLNLGYEDLLELQFARSRAFRALVIGAFDGASNDPTGEFIQKRRAAAIFVEPQPGPFNRLRERYGKFPHVMVLNAAVDEVSGFRDMFFIPAGADGLPAWTEQLASFQKDHLLNHEDRAPGLSRHIQVHRVSTISFNDLLDRYGLKSLDVLQIDAEGMDAQLLAWFPFERLKPAVLHYETAHMAPEEKRSVALRLEGFGYLVRESDSPTDDMAIRF